MIRFEKTSKDFRRARVLQDIRLEIGSHDRIALVGSNGAGKTTLIRCLLGEYICRGSVAVDDRDPRRQRTEVLQHIGFVPQLPPPLRMPVGQLVEYAARLCNTTPGRIETITTKLNLDIREIRHQPFLKLSGGQKQKLLIAIALGRDVTYLVLDEPAANLDPDARHAFFDLLAGRQDDTAMLISSHRLDEVAALVNRVVELDRGRVVLDEQVVDTVDMTTRMHCVLTLSRPGTAMEDTLRTWRFSQVPGTQEWHGSLPAGDRLRFFGMLSRYTGLLSRVHMEAETAGTAAYAVHDTGATAGSGGKR